MRLHCRSSLRGFGVLLARCCKIFHYHWTCLPYVLLLYWTFLSPGHAASVTCKQPPTENKSTAKNLHSITPGTQNVAEELIATFSCDTNIVPVPYMYWRRNGEELTNEPPYQILKTWTGSVLRIDRVNASLDDGLFECMMLLHVEGKHELEVATAMLRVYPNGLKPKGYPKMLDLPILRMLEEDSWVVLPCSHQGDPPPDIVWMKDQTPVDMNTFRYKIMNNGDLEIAYAGGGDEGLYECTAGNDIGIAYGEPIRLIVED